jgi:MFS family permease
MATIESPAGEHNWGLALSFFIGSVGMLIGGSAIVAHSFVLFLLGLLLIGAARGAIDQSRYAAADAHRPDRRGRAISMVVFAGTIGAIAGPELVGPSGNLLSGLGLPPLAGPMWSGALLFALAGAIITVLLRPDPRDIARAIVLSHPDTRHGAGHDRPLSEIMRLPNAQVALTTIVL